MSEPNSVSTAALLNERMREGIAQAGGWWPFDRFMQAALYEPGLGYYVSGRQILGRGTGSDFVTAPEMSHHFGQTLARQVAQVLRALPETSRQVWEFGAGRGALAEQMLDALDAQGLAPPRYTIVDVSGSLQAMQRERLQRFGAQVQWATQLPDQLDGVLLGNEVLDAIPVKRLAFDGDNWFERGVTWSHDAWVDADRATPLRPPDEGPFVPGSVTEIHPQAEAFTATLARLMGPGAVALFIDYGFPQAEYYHPQRSGGTLMTHRGHRADANVLADVGDKDITAHVNFTGIALAAQEAGAQVLGYTSQARFLLNCGLIDLLQDATLAQKNAAHRLIAEHEMGELFKVIAFGKNVDATLRLDGGELIGFALGDRMHRL